jgi:ribose 5-phosphate isomerase A
MSAGVPEGGRTAATFDPKSVAGRRAAEFVESGMTLGLGTGSTVYFALVRIAERIREQGLRVRGVPTSLDTERKAREMGIELASLDDVSAIDVTIDGADEIDARFDMIKGGGGALLREKIVASISKREVIVAGADKVVERLGLGFRLPVELVPFARPTVTRALEKLGCEPRVRTTSSGGEYRTDNGNLILDCKFSRGIENAAVLERAIDAIPGVVESGLFIGLAHVLVIGHADGRAEVRER